MLFHITFIAGSAILLAVMGQYKLALTIGFLLVFTLLLIEALKG